MEPTKRELRQLKREIKRAGSQRRRRAWKRDLREHPEEAPYSEQDFGRYSTAELNGIDHDQTRHRDRSRPGNQPESPSDAGHLEANRADGLRAGKLGMADCVLDAIRSSRSHHRA